MDELTTLGRPKLNLLLRVGSRRSDGYHGLCSLMVELDGPCDVIRVRAAAQRAVRCPGAEGPDNLCWTALDALERRTGRPLSAEVEIDKAIPSEAGLGGGSADAAATLVAANRLFALGLAPSDLEAVAAEVGSDVPFFVRGGAQWASGRGERLASVEAPSFAAVIVRPEARLATADVYRAFDRMPVPPVAPTSPPPGMPALALWARNDLWAPALALRPALGAAARALVAAGAGRALLCGSGACVAGLVGDRASAERVLARLAAPNAWVAEPHRRAD